MLCIWAFFQSSVTVYVLLRHIPRHFHISISGITDKIHRLVSSRMKREHSKLRYNELHDVHYSQNKFNIIVIGSRWRGWTGIWHQECDGKCIWNKKQRKWIGRPQLHYNIVLINAHSPLLLHVYHNGMSHVNTKNFILKMLRDQTTWRACTVHWQGRTPGKQSDNVTGSSPSTSVFPCQYLSFQQCSELIRLSTTLFNALPSKQVMFCFSQPKPAIKARGIFKPWRSIGVGVKRYAPATLHPGKRFGAHFTGGWVGPTPGLDGCEKCYPSCK